MPATQETPAPKRAVIGVSGPEARDFLQGLLTNSVEGPAAELGPVFAALLTPQGKILHTLFVHPAPDGVWLEVAAEGAEDLIRRLTLFRLRRKIGIEKRPGLGVALGEGAPDPRHPGLPSRAIIEGPERADWDSYDATRIALAVPEQGRDYGAEEVFPADANLDLLRGVDLKKGCFVGQEVVSRMHRKGGVRKRMCAIAFEGDAPAYGAQIMDEAGATIGTVRSTRGGRGIALARVDRLAEAKGILRADGKAVEIVAP